MTIGFGLASLGASGRRVVVRSDDRVIDVAALPGVPYPELLGQSTLDALLAAGCPAWQELHGWLADRLADPDRFAARSHPVAGVTPELPFNVADFVDFYASKQHASNAGRILRPEAEDPLTPNWRHHPVGYHGRAGSVVVSGTPVVRPNGQRAAGDFGPTRALDFEAELGFVLGGASTPGEPVSMDRALDYVFGLVLLNDWSARDVQAWEARPLGPFLGKSFATSISPWVVPLAELDAAWVDPPPRDPPLLPYLCGAADRGLDVALDVRCNGSVISRPPAAGLYWTPAQFVVHLTSNGAAVRPGDLLGSGTVSGASRAEWGCLLEISSGGAQPITLADGSERHYLRDGDELTISATAPGPGRTRIDLGEVTGRIEPAH